MDGGLEKLAHTTTEAEESHGGHLQAGVPRWRYHDSVHVLKPQDKILHLILRSWDTGVNPEVWKEDWTVPVILRVTLSSQFAVCSRNSPADTHRSNALLAF